MAKQAEPKLRRMIIEPAANGGHSITHEYPHEVSGDGAMMTSKEPESHIFGPSESEKGIMHVDHYAGFHALEHEDEQEPEPKSLNKNQ